MDAVREIQKRQNQYLAATGGVWALREADEKYNDMNREIIEAFKQTHGTAFLGNINFYGEERQKVASKQQSVYKEYTGQLVYNFGCAFVVPAKDEVLENLIFDWNTDKKAASECHGLIDKIIDRINELGGVNFVWY